MEFIFWFKILSPHQMPYICELANLNHRVTVISEAEMSKDRSKLGWTVPAVGKVNVELKLSEDEIKEVIKKMGKNAIHFIGELRFEPRGEIILRHLNEYGARFGIVTESPDSRGIFGVFRKFKYILEYYRQGRRFDFVLAMGKKGFNWFIQCGYTKSKVFEFAYAVDNVGTDKLKTANPLDSPFRFLYVGQLIQRKGVDLLIRCLASIEESFKLEIVGSGTEEEKLKELSEQLGLESQITWTVCVSSNVVREKMACSDALVLPSYHDGWGAVISEALLSGTPVICSDACGASCLISSEECGAVFASQNLIDLKRVVADRIRRGKQSQENRELLKSYSRERHGSTAVAKYFELVMQHVYDGNPRPTCISTKPIQL
ncbi:MAG: glycosyltransferase involved in cell wall biosynthesis [Candidatus Endobugula sp.]|jgi:glycosyltransferase involved in cell wall biosynthesis